MIVGAAVRERPRHIGRYPFGITNADRRRDSAHV
jgi:hypothetical protein